jgi:hypothetical protein
LAARKLIKEETCEKNKFTKEQLLQSKRYIDRTDLLNVLLEADKSYSLEEVDGLIEDFMKGKVN